MASLFYFSLFYKSPLAIALYVIILNFRGASAAAKLQAFLTKALLGGMLLAMIVSFIKGSPKNILPTFEQVQGPLTETEASGMFPGIVSVLVMTPFFYAGFDTIPQQAEEASSDLDWTKFGRVISAALLASGVFYMICIYSFGTIIPWTEFIKSTVPALAVLKRINMILYVAMLIVATLGPMGPMNSFYGATSRIMLAMGRKGQLPPAFAKLDANGVPRTANICMAIFTLVGPFLGKKMLVPLTNVSALAFIFSCTMVCFSCFKMRYTEPDLKRPFKVPGGKFGIALGCIAGLIVIGLLVVPASPASLKPVEWIIVAVWLLIGLILKLVSAQLHKKKS